LQLDSVVRMPGFGARCPRVSDSKGKVAVVTGITITKYYAMPGKET
jgi:hypothetical protein